MAEGNDAALNGEPWALAGLRFAAAPEECDPASRPHAAEARFKPRHRLGQGSTGRHRVAGREQVVQQSNLASIVPFAAGSEAAEGRAAAAAVVVAAGLCRVWEPWLSVSPRENAAPAQSRRITLQGRGHQVAIEGAGLPGPGEACHTAKASLCNKCALQAA